jgi:hypothetical protein
VRQVHASHCEVMPLTASLFIGSILELFRLPNSPGMTEIVPLEGITEFAPAPGLGTRGWQHVCIGGISNADRH